MVVYVFSCSAGKKTGSKQPPSGEVRGALSANHYCINSARFVLEEIRNCHQGKALSAQGGGEALQTAQSRSGDGRWSAALTPLPQVTKTSTTPKFPRSCGCASNQMPNALNRHESSPLFSPSGRPYLGASAKQTTTHNTSSKVFRMEIMSHLLPYVHKRVHRPPKGDTIRYVRWRRHARTCGPNQTTLACSIALW